VFDIHKPRGVKSHQLCGTEVSTHNQHQLARTCKRVCGVSFWDRFLFPLYILVATPNKFRTKIPGTAKITKGKLVPVDWYFINI
jgi:hypothetical protein